MRVPPEVRRDEVGRERGALGRHRAQPEPDQAASRPRRAHGLLGDARQVSSNLLLFIVIKKQRTKNDIRRNIRSNGDAWTKTRRPQKL